MGDRMGRQEETPMLRLSRGQPSPWESVLPPELFQMNEELTYVDLGYWAMGVSLSLLSIRCNRRDFSIASLDPHGL